jgi:hypothetical protein
MADTHQGNPFIDQLLHDLRLDQLPEPKRTELLGKITELAHRRILQTIVMNMDQTALDEFEKKLQGGMSEDEAVTFMTEKVPGLSAKIEQALRDLYTRLVADVDQVDQALAELPAKESAAPLVVPQETPQQPGPPPAP